MTPRSLLISTLTLGLVLSGCSAFTASLENPESAGVPSTASDAAITPSDQESELPVVSEGPFAATCDELTWANGEVLEATRSSGRSVTQDLLEVSITEWSLPGLAGDRINAVDEICSGVVLAADNSGETILIELATGMSQPSAVLERSGTIESVDSRGIESGGPTYGIRDLVITPKNTYYSVGVVDEEASCLRMEVRRIDTATLLGASREVTSDIIYESSPCVDFSDERRIPAPLKIHLGGALAVDVLTDTVYLTIGDYHLGASRISQAEAAGIESTELDYALLLDESAAISALVSIANASTTPVSTVAAKGLRNPLGLTFDDSGSLWLSEMGPGGGDEINLMTPGSDYGWPLTSPGAPYDRSSWPEDPNELPAPFLDFSNRGIPGVTAPVRTWTPAIAPAALDFLASDVTGWGSAAGALVLGTLRDQALYLLDPTSAALDTVVRIPLERRLRDTIVTTSGHIVSVTDEATLTVVTPE